MHLLTKKSQFQVNMHIHLEHDTITIKPARKKAHTIEGETGSVVINKGILKRTYSEVNWTMKRMKENGMENDNNRESTVRADH